MDIVWPLWPLCQHVQVYATCTHHQFQYLLKAYLIKDYLITQQLLKKTHKWRWLNLIHSYLLACLFLAQNCWWRDNYQHFCGSFRNSLDHQPNLTFFFEDYFLLPSTVCVFDRFSSLRCLLLSVCMAGRRIWTMSIWRQPWWNMNQVKVGMTTAWVAFQFQTNPDTSRRRDLVEDWQSSCQACFELKVQEVNNNNKK